MKAGTNNNLRLGAKFDVASFQKAREAMGYQNESEFARWAIEETVNRVLGIESLNISSLEQRVSLLERRLLEVEKAQLVREIRDFIGGDCRDIPKD